MKVHYEDTPESQYNVDEQAAPVQTGKDYSFTEAVVESVTGDVYSDEAAARWQDLSFP